MYIFSGTVIHGNKRGKALGFPTANIRLETAIPEGLYLSYAKIDNQKYPSLTFIGSARTFNEEDYKAEVYILNFAADLYGKMLQVEILEKLRNNRKFVNGEELVKQMEKDKKQAEDYFSKAS